MWKWIVIEGNFFINSRIINCITSQLLITNFKSGCRTPALSKVEFIVTGAAITMFLVKLVFLLYLSSVAWNIFWYATARRRFFNNDFIRTDLFFLFLTCSSSPSNFAQKHNCERFFNIFKHDVKLYYLWQEKWKLLILSMNGTLSWSYEWNWLCEQTE